MKSNRTNPPNEAALRRYGEQLQTLLQRLRQETASIEEQARTPAGGQAAGELSNAPMHLADGGSEEYAQNLSAALLGNEEYLSTEVRAALDRMALGVFGHCEDCGTTIPRERLDAMPWTRYCVECAAKAGAGVEVNLNSGRPSSAPELAPERRPADLERVATNEGRRQSRADEDIHAAGTPGGGAAHGGLAGTNVGHGDPDLHMLQQAGGSSEFDVHEDNDDDDHVPQSGRSGGAVGGSPAGKRSARD